MSIEEIQLSSSQILILCVQQYASRIFITLLISCGITPQMYLDRFCTLSSILQSRLPAPQKPPPAAHQDNDSTAASKSNSYANKYHAPNCQSVLILLAGTLPNPFPFIRIPPQNHTINKIRLRLGSRIGSVMCHLRALTIHPLT